jgi:hypothetical protein
MHFNLRLQGCNQCGIPSEACDGRASGEAFLNLINYRFESPSSNRTKFSGLHQRYPPKRGREMTRSFLKGFVTIPLHTIASEEGGLIKP